jgi:nitrile hydratase accessory protein
MTRTAKPTIAEMPGQASLPRRSGELVFHDQWERRVFALAVSLCEQGYYSWDEFREYLIAEIGAAERAEKSHPTGHPQPYYESWLAAFEKLLVKKQICVPSQLLNTRDK